MALIKNKMIRLKPKYLYILHISFNIDVIIFQSKRSQDKKDSDLRMIQAAG